MSVAETWDEHKGTYREKYKFTKPMRLTLNCELDKQVLDQVHEHPDKGVFAPFSRLVKSFDDVERQLEIIVGTYHKLDDKKDMAFFMDEVSVSNFNAVDSIKSANTIGCAVELPNIPHTNTLPYRVFNDDRYRCIHNAVEKDEMPSFSIHNGHLVQQFCEMNSSKKHTLMDLDMSFTHKLKGEAVDPKKKQETLDDIRTSMLHMLELFDIKKAYPSHRPVQSQSYKQTHGLAPIVHLPPDAYTTSWVAGDYNPVELQAIGAAVDAEKYTQLAHKFFEKYSKARMANFNQAGLFLSTDGARSPGHLQFTLEMIIRPIVKKLDVPKETHVMNRSSETVREEMTMTKNTTEPFAK